MHIYADYAATAPLRREVLEAMTPWLTGGYGNASSIYGIAREAKKALEDARRSVAASLGVLPEEVYFTSGGTESDNWALKGAMEFGAKQDFRHMVTTVIEHPGILQTAAWLERQGFEITTLPVDGKGLITPEQTAAAVRKDTRLVSVVHANNEIGTIQPIADIFRAVKEKNPKTICHTDAVQSAGHIPVPLENVDMLSLSAHKMGGPKGTGALIVRRSVQIAPLIHGGGHERGRRSGTENVAGAVGLATALALGVSEMPKSVPRLTALRDRLIASLLNIPYSRLTGDPEHRLPGHVSVVFECVEGESMVLGLDLNGICASSGSACSSGSLDPSHVLLAVGLPHEIAHGSVRLTIGGEISEAEVDFLAETTGRVVAERRAMSPVWDQDHQKPIPFEV